MARFERQYFSIVLLGRHNPQILNHDFLVQNEVLPHDVDPFAELLRRPEAPPFSEFVSTPVLVSLQYGPITIMIDENRYQAVDAGSSDPQSSPITTITQRYFRLLRYTPVTLGGLNFHGVVRFEDDADEHAVDERLGIQRGSVAALAGSVEVRTSLTFSAPWREGSIELQVVKPRGTAHMATINFNFEFPYDGMDAFLSRLDNIDDVSQRFEELLKSLDLSV
jgi:hypothetical protein